MRYKPDAIYVLFRNGKRFRHFSTETNAKQYYCACRDLFPDEQWELRVEEVNNDA